MSTTIIYNNFKSLPAFRNKFRRSEYCIWDANLHHGDVRPFACPEIACEDVPTSTLDLYPLPECKCNYFEGIADPSQGFCHDQHFFIQNNQLRQATTEELCAGDDGCLAGAPFPQSKPSVSNNCGDCDAVGMSYVVTYVTSHAGILVESAPSPASDIVACMGNIPGCSVSWGGAPAGYCIVSTRLYRVESTFEDGTSAPVTVGSEYVFVAEFGGGGGGGFTDNVATADTGAPLTTYDPMSFPAPNGVRHLTRTGDGIAVATDSRVYISISGQPQFSFDGVVEIEDEILAIEAIDTQIFVFTNNYPVKIIYQVNQGIMSIERNVVLRRLPLKSKRSVSVYDDKVFFSSTYSLYSWDRSGYGSDVQSELKPLLTPEQWKAIDPTSVVGTAYEFGYIFSSDTMDHSLMLEFGGDGTDTTNETSLMPISYINADAFTTDYDGHIVYQEGGNIYCWDWRRDVCNFDICDNLMPAFCDDCCPWSLTMYFNNEGKNRFTKMRIEWDERSAPNLNAKFWHYAFGQEAEVAAFKVISSRGFSIPKYSSSQTFGVEVSGCGIMHEIRLATSNQELVSSSNNQLENAGER